LPVLVIVQTTDLDHFPHNALFSCPAIQLETMSGLGW